LFSFLPLGITFSPSIHPRVFQGDDDNMRNYNDSGNEYGSAVSEPSFNLNVEDEQIDERYLIFNTTDNTIHEVDSINENAAINTDDGYGTITETDALIDDEQDTLIETQNNAPVDEEVSTIELSIQPTLLTGNMNPLVLADIEIPTDSNADHHEGSGKLFCSTL
jgi:ribosomal protein L16 Arg81 hydroxylase